MLFVATNHLLVPTQYYDPETFQVNHLVSLFLEKGWNVTVIAPVPSYPSSSALRGCVSPTLHHERLTICRFPVIKRNGTLYSVALNSALFAVIGSILVIFYAIRYPTARVFAVQYSPFTCIFPASIAALLLGSKAGLWIFDLWPQSIATFLRPTWRSKFINFFIDAIASVVYSPFSSFFVSSPVFMQLPPVSRLKGVELLYSWEPKDVRPRLGSKPVNLADPIRLISIGNLGSAHDLDLIEDFLLLTASLNIIWSFVGGGSGMSRLRSFSSFHGLTCVTFHGFLPKQDCLKLCSQADMSIVPFKHSQVSDTICFRFVSSLSVATPIISFGESTVSELVRTFSCGFILNPSTPANFRNPRDQFVFGSSLALAECISSRLTFIRSSCRDLAFELFTSRFSESAAEASLQSFFV